MSAMQKVKDALSKAGFSGREIREGAEVGEKPSRSPHVAMDFVRRALDAAAPWWQTQGAAPKNGERIVNSPVEGETKPTALGAGRHMEAMQRKAGSRPPVGKMPDTPKGMDEDVVATAEDEIAMDDAFVLDAAEASAEIQKMQSDLDTHDRQYHGGTYKGGPCKLRDKVAKAAKTLGMQNAVINKLVGPKEGAGGGGAAGTKEVETKEEIAETETLQKDPTKEATAGNENGGGESGEEPGGVEIPAEVEKAFKDKVAAIKAKYKEARAAAEKAKDNSQINKAVNNYVKQMNAARMEYLTNALNMSPAEAGACTEVAQKLDNGSEAAQSALQEIANGELKTDNGTIKATPEEQAAAQMVLSESDATQNEEGDKPAGSANAETAAKPAEAQAETGRQEGTFEDELKKQHPEMAQMIDKLSQNFDTLNDLLNDEQKKQFFDLQENGTDEEFLSFLESSCGFNKDETSALQTLMDAYRAANPDQYPEYAKQHQNDGLMAKVKKADRRLINDVQRGKYSGIKNRLEIKGFSEEEIGQFMDSMGMTEEQKFAVMNDLPVPPKVPTEAELKKAELEKKASDAMEAYRKAHDEAKRNGKDKDPATIKELNEKLKAAMEASKAAKEPPKADETAETAAPAPAAQKEGAAPTETTGGGGNDGEPAPAQKATQAEVAAQPKDDPVKEGTTPQDHAAVCTANPKSNCPFLKAHMSQEQLAALDKPQGAETAATGETPAAAPTASSERETTSPTEGSAAPTEQSSATETPDTETAETTEAPTANGPVNRSPVKGPPLPEYKPPKVGDYEGELSDEEKDALEELREAYQNSTDPEERETIKSLYEGMTQNLDMAAAHLAEQQQLDEDARAQAEENKRPGFIQNMKDFLGGIAKSMRGDRVVDVSDKRRAELGLPKTGKIRQSEYIAANRRKADEDRRKEAEEEKKAKEEAAKAEAEKGSWRANGGVKTSSGEQSEVVNDSFLDRTQAKEGGLKDKDEVTSKIKDVLAKSGISTDGLKDRVGPSDTTFTITTKKMTPKEVEDLEGEIMRAVDRWDGKGNSTVKVSYNKQSLRLTVTIPHEDDERGDLPFAKIFDSDAWKTKTKDMEIPMMFGEDENGNPVIEDLADLTHLLVAGATGAGKSSRMGTGIVSMLMSRSPDKLGVWMIDPKRAEFTPYERDKHLLGPVAYSYEEAMQTLNEATEEMEKRTKLLQEVSRKTGLTIPDRKTYNKLAEEGKIPKEYPQFIKPAVVIIDELSQLIQDGGKEVSKKISELARLSRATGPHLIVATQRPDAETISGQIRANLPSQLGLNTRSSEESKIIFGETGVGTEKLAPKGPFILKNAKGKFIKGNGAHISNEELDGYHQAEAKINNTSDSASSSKPSSPTYVGHTPDGMEVHKSQDGKITFMHNGKQYKRARYRMKDGSVVDGWKLADGTDPTVYILTREAT